MDTNSARKASLSIDLYFLYEITVADREFLQRYIKVNKEMIRQHEGDRHTLDQIVINTGDDKMQDVTMSVCSFLHMVPEIGRSKNVSQLFGICIPLAIPMYI